jgi:hypothetical protein
MAFGLLVVGLILSGLGFIFMRRLTPEWAVVTIAGGSGLAAVGGRLFVEYVASRYGHVQVPTWMVLLILLALLAILPIAALWSH